MCYKIISFENKLNTNKIERATATQPQKNLYSFGTNNNLVHKCINSVHCSKYNTKNQYISII